MGAAPASGGFVVMQSRIRLSTMEIALVALLTGMLLLGLLQARHDERAATRAPEQ
jgi:hypothetical protein